MIQRIKAVLSRGESWPAEVTILKLTKTGIQMEKDRGRRVDEKEEEDDLVGGQVKFQLKKGGSTFSVPYSEIYTPQSGAPQVYLISPERGTYLPANLTPMVPDNVDLTPSGMKLRGEDGDWNDVNLYTQLDTALDNQEWLRWGKQIIMDVKLSFEEEGGWLERHGAKLIIALTSMLNIAAVIVLYMAVGQITDAAAAGSILAATRLRR